MVVVGVAVTLPAQMTVTLVGTGGPELTPERVRGEATLVQVGGQSLLFDAGRGVLDGLYQARVRPQEVTRVFLTHLHSDHIEGLPGLWMTPWFLLGRTEPMEVWGPAGTRAMVDGMRQMYGHDVVGRVNPTARVEGLAVTVHEIGPGVVWDAGGVWVTAIAVEHADGDPALAYRVEGAGRAVLLTGDCTLTEGLVAGAAGDAGRRLDLVVANVAAGAGGIEGMARWRPVFAKLMTPEQGAVLFERTRPRMAAYSHVVKKGLPGGAGDRVILARTRAAGYKGRLEMGRDGERIEVGATVRVLAPSVGALPDFDGPGARF